MGSKLIFGVLAAGYGEDDKACRWEHPYRFEPRGNGVDGDSHRGGYEVRRAVLQTQSYFNWQSEKEC